MYIFPIASKLKFWYIANLVHTVNSGSEIVYYPNEYVRRVLAFIPPGHFHARFVIELCNRTIILSEATVAGIVRAYVNLVIHPGRKAVELVAKHMEPPERKRGYAEWQLLETCRGEEEILKEGVEILAKATKPC